MTVARGDGASKSILLKSTLGRVSADDTRAKRAMDTVTRVKVYATRHVRIIVSGTATYTTWCKPGKVICNIANVKAKVASCNLAYFVHVMFTRDRD
jgi:hypothetical protein